MPKIADIQETPNPNAVKFILREPVSYGTSHSFKSPEEAVDDNLAKSLFAVGNVVSVFYMDKMITVEKEDLTEWDDLLPALAVPIREAESVKAQSAAAVAVGGAIAAATSDNPQLAEINTLLDERIEFGEQHTHNSLSGRVRLLPVEPDRNSNGD
jgi:NFU1 iron-sulfur cluster scaffold homolog, mitochondrial